MGTGKFSLHDLWIDIAADKWISSPFLLRLLRLLLPSSHLIANPVAIEIGLFEWLFFRSQLLAALVAASGVASLFSDCKL